MKKIKPYEETHQQGRISIENEIPRILPDSDLGIQIASDGRVWICVDGNAFLRFLPHRKGIKNEQQDKE